MVKKILLALVAVVAVVVVIVLVRGDTQEPPEEPDFRATGPWVDRIVITEEPSEVMAIARMDAGEIDLWLTPPIIDPTVYEMIVENPDIDYDLSYGGFTDLMFNVAGPYFHDGRLNPFHDAEIRQAFNWLIDRSYFVAEFLGGMGEPIYALHGKAFAEYDRYPEILGAIEEYYEHDPDKAEGIIHNRMVALGAELVEGSWHYDGEEIEIRFVIWTDLYPPVYPAGGEYIADLMEGVGFSVDRMLRSSPGAVDIWMRGDPFDGAYSLCTVGWGMAAIPREEGHRFLESDTRFHRPWPRWQVLDPPDEYLDVAKRLYDRDYSDFAERETLFEQALWMRMEFSPQILIADIAGVSPWHSSLNVRTDLSFGFGWALPQTIHFVDEDRNPVVGGTVRADQSPLLSDPWNPVDGSGLAADLNTFRHMLQERGLMIDGRDGLVHPWHIESAAVTIRDGLPVQRTHDWVTLDFADEIQAPADAWVDWDPVAQRFITVGEKTDPESVYYDEEFDPSANARSVAYYPADVYDVPMHDGSTLSLADIVMAMIMRFDRAKPESAVYDEREVARLASFMAHFRGVRIVSEDPLIIVCYSKQWFLDAERNVVTWFPAYGIYEQFAPWHVITIGKMAEADLALAWSADKAAQQWVEWMDYTKGPSLPILSDRLDRAIADDYIPYEPTLADYITDAQAAERYGNLKAWYAEVGHFWTTTAPFYLHTVRPLEGVIDLRRFEDHPDPIDRWMFLMEDL